jgi:SAM-dependent methyltransferase
MESIRHWLARLRGRKLNKLLPGRGQLMDFGSGAGHFATAQAKAGWTVVALDPYSPTSTSSDFVFDQDRITLNFPDQSFDAVTLWYVIEHLSNPRAVVEELHRIMKPGGILVLAQQDFASLQAKLFGPRWLFLDPPRHLWQFTIRSLSEMVHQTGYEVVRVQHSSIEMGPFTILQSMLNCIVGNNNYLFKFLKNRKLRQQSRGSWLRTLASVVLLPILGPLSLLAYFGLLVFRSGDIFVLYCRRV